MRYLAYSAISLIGTLLAFPLAPILALFLDSRQNLKYGRALFQPSDNPAIGDALWQASHPNRYWSAVTYLWCNPAQGLDQYLKADVGMGIRYTLSGNINISDHNGIGGWYLITAGKYFHFSYVLPIGKKCITGGFGWRLNNIVLGYPHKTMGQLVFTPFRLFNFGK